MARIFKREGKKGVSWVIDYFDPNGKRVRQAFKRKKDAEAELGKRVSLKAEGRYLDYKPDYTFTLGELVDKYAENFNDQVSWKKGKEAVFEEFMETHKRGARLSDIRFVDMETFRNNLKKRPHQKKAQPTTLKPATINKAMSHLHHLFQKGVEWEMMETNPFNRGKLTALKMDNARLRFLTDEEIDRLLEECHRPYLRRLVEFAINTGMRKGEILNLKWEHIKNGMVYLPGDMTKARKARQVPLNDDMKALTKEIRREEGLSSPYVFTKNGERIKKFYKAFMAACERATVFDLTFHDLRHTFSSHVIMRGGSLKDLQELLGHESLKMTMRYSHLTQEHKQKAVNLLNGLTKKTVIGTKVAQIKNRKL